MRLFTQTGSTFLLPACLFFAAIVCPTTLSSAQEKCKHDQLKVRGRIVGKAIWVMRGKWEPMPALNVAILDLKDGKFLASGRSDKKGAFLISGVGPGIYRVIVSHPIVHWVGDELALEVEPARDSDEKPDLITFTLGKGPRLCGGWQVKTSKLE